LTEVKQMASVAKPVAASPRRLGVTQPVEIGQGRIDRFAEATGDHQWIHVDSSVVGIVDLLETEPHPSGVRSRVRVEVTGTNADKPCCVAELVVLHLNGIS
jgi:acyl dehydratase